ncbi:RluA family pseudouridine synthase [Peptacetobacter sp. AB845]|uniref:RluA family pseudouridine synthase n=1 Tax=Peptacetobacter sp. AB845 TaxID=3388429 RepID=UPI0039C8EC6E
MVDNIKKENLSDDNCEEIREFLVEEDEEGDRLDVYLSDQFVDMSRSYIQKIIKDKKVTVNGKVEKAKYLVKEEDKVVIEIPKPKILEVVPQDIPIEIVYEDDDIIIVNKPQGMVVHPAPGNYEGTLVNAILYHCKGNLSSINGVIRPGIVHRIDKDTSGILMIAKNNNAHNCLAEQLKDHSITREYEFICHGVFKEDNVTVDRPIGRNPKDRLKMAIVPNGKRAVTHFEVIERFNGYTHVRARLETGRTHQIRVHAMSINHPLVGDPVYGPKNSKIKLNGQALHAKKLGFIHPTTKEYVEFDSELPDYFQKLLEKLRKY